MVQKPHRPDLLRKDYPRILVVNRTQYGYHTDSYQLTRQSTEKAQVTYLCFDQNRPKYEHSEGLNVSYISPSRTKAFRFWRLIKSVLEHSRTSDLIYLYYFPFCSFLSAINVRKILDLRSRNVSESTLNRSLGNILIFIELRLFKRIVIVSEELARSFRLKKFKVLPLGADISCDYNKPSKTSESLRLIYVGSLIGRDLSFVVSECLDASRRRKLQLTVVGNDNFPEVDLLKRSLSTKDTSGVIKFTGYLKGDELLRELMRADVGIAHIPDDARYRGQPSTKLFEYWGAGLPVLGNDYDQNRKLIGKELGLLYKSEKGKLSSAIISFDANQYDSQLIRASLEVNNWDCIREEFWQIIFRSMSV